MIAISLVSGGKPDHDSEGEMSLPSPVCFFGIGPFGGKDVLVTTIAMVRARTSAGEIWRAVLPDRVEERPALPCLGLRARHVCSKERSASAAGFLCAASPAAAAAVKPAA